MSDTALAEPRETRAPRVTGKLKSALELMVDDGLRINEAAETVGMTTHAIREAFGKPHVLAFVRKRKQQLRESVSARNITRLAEIRDAADNMPAVQAIKLLEEMGDEHAMRSQGVSASPGVTIRIVNVNSGQAMAPSPVTESRVIDGEVVEPANRIDRGEK